MTFVAWVTVAIFVGVYVLVATERVHRVAAALGGSALVLGFGIVGSEEAFYSPETGIDWDVIFLLLGMMLVVGVIRRTGVFEYLAIRSAKLARGRPYGVLVLLVLVTAGASALLDNVTTVLLVAPVTLLVCDRLGLKPIPFLLAEALASNIGGASTLVGDPPNIIIASRADLSFTDFLVHMMPIVLVVLAAFLVLARFLFRRALVGDPARASALMALDEREAITDRRLLVRSAVVLAAILLGFLLQRQTGVAPSVVALVGAGVLLLLSPLRPRDLIEDVEWETLLFFMGLFIVVGALVEVGALDALAERLVGVTGGALVPTLLIVLIGSAVVSAVVDNIPYVTAMTPVVASLIETNPELGEDGALWWALALGADLGGNATLVGASANVVIVGIAARNGLHIAFKTWLRYGVPTAVMSIALCIPYVVIRYG
jgi:Na+/H+ antiporter NhaD/arsenite permease-like protein